jgi:hypothetical protein
MAYSAISTLSNGGTVSHGHLNTLQDNAEFLRNIAKRANWPCASIHRNAVTGFTVDTQHYFFRHANSILRFQVENASGTLEQVRVYYNSRKVYGNESPGTPLTVSVNLHDLSTWTNYAGAWVTATGYDEDEDGDGEIVSRSGVYYLCTSSHTSGGTTEPGVGVDWATVWSVVTQPTLGGRYKCYFHVTFVTGSNELAINYVYEDAIS